MKTVTAFFRLIRLPNLIFIALTQILFYTCVVFSLHREWVPDFRFSRQEWMLLSLLILASVFIAAAGYIINDYFDRSIDAINKPEKVVIDRTVKRRWAIMWHLVLSAIGLLLSAYVAYRTKTYTIFFANIACVFLLWVYSTTFKKKLLSGNIMIAALTAWVIVVLYFFSGASLLDVKGWNEQSFQFDIRKLFKVTILYAGFAFIVSLIREVVKDLEDMHGDARYHCKTMPIVWGVPATKVFAAVWLVVAMASLAIIQVYAWQSGWWYSALYCIVLIIVPMGQVLRLLYKAVTPAHYHHISSYIKWIMLAGILSMIFFRFIHYTS